MRVLTTSRGAPFPPPSSRREILSLRARERIPGVPVASQEVALSRGKGRGTPGSCHHCQSPPDVSVHSREPGFPALPRLSSRGSTHTTVARGTALWESLMGKPRGKASWESLVGKPRVKASRERHRSLDPSIGKRDTAASAREESARAFPHSRRRLTPLGRLQNYPKIQVRTGEECSGSGTYSTQDLCPSIDGRGIPRGPRATRMGTGLS